MASGQPLLTGISLDSKDGDVATLEGTGSELSSPARSCPGARQRARRGSHMAPLLPTLGPWASRAPPRSRGPPSAQGPSHLLPQQDSPQHRACLGLRKARARPTEGGRTGSQASAGWETDPAGLAESWARCTRLSTGVLPGSESMKKPNSKKYEGTHSPGFQSQLRPLQAGRLGGP